MSSIYIQEPPTNGKVCLRTSVGEIDIELWSREAPKACRNFVQLCLEGYYNGCVFHRLIAGFIVQGGDPTGTGQGGDSIYDEPFKDEFHQRLRYARRGLVGMANGGADDNASQFFFTLGPTPELQNKNTLFAKVVGDTLFNMLKLAECQVDKNERPKIVRKILGAEVLNNPFPDMVPRQLSRPQDDDSEARKPATAKAVKNFALLSFGGEDDEDADDSAFRQKPKSAHDVLSGTDQKLSAQPAVTDDELRRAPAADEPAADGADEGDDADEASSLRARIRNKLGQLKKARRAAAAADGMGEDEDLDKIVATAAADSENAKVGALKAEYKVLQKAYKKLLYPDEEKPAEPEVLSEAIASYRAEKDKYMVESKKLPKAKSVPREQQTLELLSKFKQRLETAKDAPQSSEDIAEVVVEKKVGNPDDSEEEEPEDIPIDTWLSHKFVAPEEAEKPAVGSTTRKPVKPVVAEDGEAEKKRKRRLDRDRRRSDSPKRSRD